MTFSFQVLCIISEKNCFCCFALLLSSSSIPRQVFTNCVHGYDRARKRRYTCVKIRARHWFFYVKIIWICQWVLPFFLPFFCPVLGCLLLSFIVLSCLLPRCAALYRFCSPTINQIFLSQLEGWFSFILLCRLEKYCWTGPLGLC